MHKRNETGATKRRRRHEWGCFARVARVAGESVRSEKIVTQKAQQDDTTELYTNITKCSLKFGNVGRKIAAPPETISRKNYLHMPETARFPACAAHKKKIVGTKKHSGKIKSPCMQLVIVIFSMRCYFPILRFRKSLFLRIARAPSNGRSCSRRRGRRGRRPIHCEKKVVP